MNLLFLLLPIWVLSSTLLSAPIDVGSKHPVSAISEPVVPTDKEPISQISSDAEPHSPGTPEIKVVHHHDLDKRILIALIVASSLFGGILLLLSCFWVCRLHKIKNSNTKGQKCLEDPKLLSPVPILGKFNSLKANVKKGSAAVIDYQKLLAATNNFKEENIVGEGGIGRVYKAQFDDNSFAAVKRLNGGGQDAERQFEKELNWLNKIQHQNIVSLLGYCVRGETMLLVYEMMHNGSLESQLHGPSHGSALTWHLRMKIALDIARGLEFLHERCNPPVIHRDLKSSNILLDCDFNAKLSDFGLAISGGAHSKNNLKLSGTLGYVAPEYLLDGKLTDKSDVYAFGVILLELLTGKKAVEKIEPSQCQSIVSWAMPQLTDRSKLSNIVDPAIRNTMDLKHLYQVAAVAVLCIQPEPSYRPLITDVLHSFIPLVPVELGGSLRVSEAVISGRS